MVKIWGAQTGALHHTFEGSGSSIEWLCWHPRGDVVVAGTEDYMAFMWNAGSGVTMQVSQTSGSSAAFLLCTPVPPP